MLRFRASAGKSNKTVSTSWSFTGDRWFESISLRRRVREPSVPPVKSASRRPELSEPPADADGGEIGLSKPSVSQVLAVKSAQNDLRFSKSVVPSYGGP